MNCAGCNRELEVGDRYIKFTMDEWGARQGLAPLGMDDLFAGVLGSNAGDKIVYCDDCTKDSDDGWPRQTVYGDEEPG